MNKHSRSEDAPLRKPLPVKRLLRHALWVVPAVLALLLAVVLLIPLFDVQRGDRAMEAENYPLAVDSYRAAADYAVSPLPHGIYRLGEGLGMGSYPDHTADKLAQAQQALVQQQIAQGKLALEAGDVEEGEAILLALPVGEATAADTISAADRARLEEDIAFAQALKLEEAGEYLPAAEVFDTLTLREDAPAAAARCRAEQVRDDALALQGEKKFDSALRMFADAAILPETAELIAACEAERAAYLPQALEASRNTIAASAWNTALSLDGTPMVLGDAIMAQPEAGETRFFSGLTGIYALQEGKIRVLRGGSGFSAELEALDDVRQVSGGLNHVLALQGDGSVAAFGSDAFGQVSGVAGQQARSLAAGALHSVLLREDASVLALGDNSYGQCEANGATNVSAVAAGLHHSVLLKADGTVEAYGDNSYGQCEVSSWENIRAVYCGGNFTLGLTRDFTLVACGDDRYQQCQVEDFRGIVSVACGMWHTAAIDLEGNLFLSGSNGNGQLTLPGSAPVAVSRISDTLPEDVYTTSREGSPQLFLNHESIISVYYDHGEHEGSIRGDLFTTYGHPPFGAFAQLHPEGRGLNKQDKISRENRVVFAMTGDFIRHTVNYKGVMLRQGRLFYEEAEAPTMALLPNGEMRLYEEGEVTSQELLDLGVKDSFAFGPILVHEGQIHPTTATHFLANSNQRSSIGMAEAGHFITINTRSGYRCTLHELAQRFLDYGCSEAYNLDGGNSTGVAFMGQFVCPHHGLRAVPDVLALGVTESVPTLKDPYIRLERYQDPNR